MPDLVAVADFPSDAMMLSAEEPYSLPPHGSRRFAPCGVYPLREELLEQRLISPLLGSAVAIISLETQAYQGLILCYESWNGCHKDIADTADTIAIALYQRMGSLQLEADIAKVF